MVDCIHQLRHLVEPVLQSVGQVGWVEAAAVGVGEDDLTDVIVVGHEDGAALGSVEDVVAAVVSGGAEHELPGGDPLPGALRGWAEELCCGVAGLLFAQRVGQCAVARQQKQQEEQSLQEG